MTETRKIPLTLDSMDAYMSLFGLNDQNVALVEQECGVAVSLRGSELFLTGEAEDAALAESVILKLLEMIRRGDLVDRTRIRYAIALAREGDVDRIDEILRSVVAITHRGKQIRCKTLGQQEYVQAIRDHDLTFAVGPAGTGKTYLAMALAVVALKNKEIERIVLTRPAVEAGEKLGFLPGDLTQKVDPYLRPLYDALHDMLEPETIPKLMEAGTIEVAPLAYMRGRTLNDAFIILDEAQNTTAEQMKMFLTRLGFGSKMVITGDITQIDLPGGAASGLKQVRNILQGVEDIHFSILESSDVVRHTLVSNIVSAYDQWGEDQKAMERKRNRKVKRATIEAAAEKLLDRAGINGGSEKNAAQNQANSDNAQTTPEGR